MTTRPTRRERYERGSTPAVERHRHHQHDRRRRRTDHPDPDVSRLGPGSTGVLRRRRVPGELSRSAPSVLARRPDPAVVHALDPRCVAAAGPGPQHAEPGAVPAACIRDRLHRRAARHPGDPARVPHRLRRARGWGCRGSGRTRSSGARSPSCCRTRPTPPRSSGPASTACTRANGRRPGRSACRAARRCRP